MLLVIPVSYNPPSGVPVPGEQADPGGRGPLPRHLLPPDHVDRLRVRQAGGRDARRPPRPARSHSVEREAEREGEEEKAEKVQGLLPGDISSQGEESMLFSWLSCSFDYGTRHDHKYVLTAQVIAPTLESIHK